MLQSTQQQQLQRLEEVRLRIRDEGIEPLHKPKSQTDYTFIVNCLRNHFIFYNISQRELSNVKDHMFWFKMPEGAEVFRQGVIGSCFFIIVSGVVDVIVDNQVVKTLRAAEGFGELALLYDIERPSTVVVKQNASFWVIDKVSFRDAVEEIVISQFQENQKYLQGLAFYQFLSNRQKEQVASSFVTLKYYKGQNIIEEGDPGSAFYIIKEGTASLIQGSIEQRKIYKGESFGLNSLYYNTMRKITVRAEEEVTCQVLGRETLSLIIGTEVFRQTMFRNYAKYIFQKSRGLFQFIKRNEEKCFQNMKVRYYKTNQVVLKKGSTVHRLFIVMEGTLKKFRSANFLAESGQIWGQTYLQGNETRLEDDIVVETQSVLLEFNLQNLKAVKQTVSMSKIEIKMLERQSIDIRSIAFLGELQTGLCNTVSILKSDNKWLVGKLYKKRQMEKQSMTNIVRQSCQVEQQAVHPCLPHFYQVIDTEHFTFKISQYIRGESFYDTMRVIGLLSTLDCQFYAASIILLLEYLASIDVVIRDLKPDNLIVDQRGYIFLVSLGSAKQIAANHRTSTVIGTPHYMAPEVVLGKQYNQIVDLWSLGIILYQCMVGELPFGSETENPYQIYEAIIQGEATFPRNFKDRRAKKLIENMLNSNPQSRHNGSYSSLKSSSWFQNINWDDILDRRAHTPYKPTKFREVHYGPPIKLQQFLRQTSKP